MNQSANTTQPLTTSIVVTCKNRLHHLKQTLPKFTEQSHSEVIVVDYGCSQGTKEWVESHFQDTNVRVLSVDDDPMFCLARARNLGANIAVGDYLLFIDADVLVEIDLGSWIKENASPSHYYRAARPFKGSLAGTCVCPTDQFVKSGGYDEAFRSWGGEDTELYMELDSMGLNQADLPKDSLMAIDHGDNERQISIDLGGTGSKNRQLILFNLYSNLKSDIQQLNREKLPLQERIKIMQIAQNVLTKMTPDFPHDRFNIEVQLNDLPLKDAAGFPSSKRPIRNPLYSRKLIYSVSALVKKT